MPTPYRRVARHGWSDLVFTHISGRIPGPGHHVLINPCNVFESTCQIQLAAPSGGAELTHVKPAILDGVAHAMKVQTGGLGGALVCPALIRQLDRLDPAYKT